MSSGHPLLSTFTPFAVPAHLSSLSATPSPSVSGQPFRLTGPANSGHASSLSAIPSLSESGHPFSEVTPATVGQSSI